MKSPKPSKPGATPKAQAVASKLPLLKTYQPPYSEQFQLRDVDEEMIYAVIPHKGDKAQARANADYIATATNSHAALVQALQAVNLQAFDSDGDCSFCGEGYLPNGEHNENCVLVQVKAALKLAGKEE